MFGQNSKNPFTTIGQKFQGGEGQARLYGLGLLAGQLAQGQSPNAGPALKMLDERRSQRAFKDQMGDSKFMAQFTPEERQFLTTLEPRAAQELIMQRIFAAPASPEVINDQLVDPSTGKILGDYRSSEPIEINGQLVDPQTRQVVGDYRDPQEEDNYRTLSSEEVRTLGLPDGYTWQEGPDGKINQVDGSGQTTRYVATGDRAKSLGGDPSKLYNVEATPDGLRLSEVGGGGVNVETHVSTTGESAFNKKTGELLATEAATVAEQGATAQRGLVRIDRLAEALANTPDGAAGGLAAWAGNLGIKTENASDIELAQSIISSLVPEQRPAGSGPMSDADLELFKQSLPRLINTKGGNRQIIDTLRRIAEYDMQRGEIARQLQLGKLTREQAFSQYSQLGNPLQGYRQNSDAASLGLTADDLEFLEQ